MPHIQDLTVRSRDGQPTDGFRSLLGHYRLPPCLLLAGSNGAGKTAHLNLIEAGVMGLTTSRAVGGKTSATDAGRVCRLHLGTDLYPSAEVVVGLSTGASFTRPLDTASENAKAVKEADAEARRLVGQPAVSWTPDDFLHSSGTARQQLFAAAAQAGGVIEAWDTARAMAETRALLIDALPDGVDLAAWIAPLDKLCSTYTAAEGGGGEWLVIVSTPAEAHRLAAGRTKDSTEAAYQERMAARAPKPAHNRAEARARAAAASVRQHAAQQAQAQADRYAQALAAHEAEVTRLREALAGIVTQGKGLRSELEAAKAAPAPTAEPPPADVHAESEAARASVDAPVPPPDGSRIPELETAVRRAEAEHAAAKTAAEDAAGTLAADKAQRQPLRIALDAAVESDQAATRHMHTARGTLAALESQAGAEAVCVHCNGSDPLGHGAKLDAATEDLDAAERAAVAADRELQDAKRIYEEGAAKVTASTDALTQAANAETTARLALESARQALAAARSDLAGHDTHIRAERTARLARAQAAVDRARAQAEAAHGRALTAHRQRTLAAQAAVDKLLASHKQTADALKTAEAAPPAAPTEAADVSDVPAILAECAAVEAAWVAFDLAEQQAEQSAAAALTAKVAHMAADATVQALRGAREHLASSAYAPVEAHMRAIMARCGDSLPVPYFRGPDDIGATRPGKVDVDLAGLSRSEQLITLATLTAAMSRIAGLPLVIVMLDEIGKLQSDHRVPLLRGLCEARAAGEIDQLLATLPTPKDDAEAEAELSPYREIVGLEVRRLTPRVDAPVVARIAPAVQTASDGSAGLKLDDELPF